MPRSTRVPSGLFPAATLEVAAITVLTFVAAALALASLAHAQNPQPMDPNAMMRQLQDPAAMERMAAQAEAAQQCMADIDQDKLDALEKKARQASGEIERLCAAGKRDEALAKGLALSREMSTDETVQKLRECTKDLNEMMKQMMPTSIPGVADDGVPTDDDICS